MQSISWYDKVAVSTLETALEERQHITPPSSFEDASLTSLPTHNKAFTQAPQVIALFKEIKAGRHFDRDPWTRFQLVQGEYDEIERQLRRDEELFGFSEDKIRYDYDGRNYRLVVRLPSDVHEIFIDRVEDAIRSQLKAVRKGSNEAARFARKVHPMRSTRFYFPVEEAPLSTNSKHEPDASFRHSDADYPGVIIEVTYSTKTKSLSRLAEDYLLDSAASVQVVVGLDIEYGKKRSPKATLSVWRTQVFHTADEDELRVVQEIKDEAFRDDKGNPTNHSGLRLQLSDFACESLIQDAMRGESHEILVSTQQLCEYLDAAEDMIRRLRAGLLVHNSLPPTVKICKRPATPPKTIAAVDEAKIVEQEERVEKRMADVDADYENTSTENTSSD